MILSLSLNLLVALIWLFLQPQPSGGAFVIGLLVGFGLIALFRPVLNSHGYVRRTVAVVRFVFVFAWEFLLASWQIAKAALFRSSGSLSPAIVRYETGGLSRFEALLLSHCISLTPGTTTLEITPDLSSFTLHVLDCDDAAAVNAAIDRTLKSGILAFTR